MRHEKRENHAIPGQVFEGLERQAQHRASGQQDHAGHHSEVCGININTRMGGGETGQESIEKDIGLNLKQRDHLRFDALFTV